MRSSLDTPTRASAGERQGPENSDSRSFESLYLCATLSAQSGKRTTSKAERVPPMSNRRRLNNGLLLTFDDVRRSSHDSPKLIRGTEQPPAISMELPLRHDAVS